MELQAPHGTNHTTPDSSTAAEPPLHTFSTMSVSSSVMARVGIFTNLFLGGMLMATLVNMPTQMPNPGHRWAFSTQIGATAHAAKEGTG